MYLRAGEVASALVEITESKPESNYRIAARLRSQNAWNEEHISILKEKWGNGLSSSQIGFLVHKTRNAVIGKARRLGLAKIGPSPSRMGSTVVPMVVPRDKKPNNFPPPPPPSPRPRPVGVKVLSRLPPRPRYAEPVGFTTKPPITIMQLRSTTCRAPMGKGEDGMETYCGGETFMKKAFCEGHCALFYAIPESRRRDQSRLGEAIRAIPEPLRKTGR